MSDAENLINVLTVIAIVFVVIIIGLVVVYFFYKNKKYIIKENEKKEDEKKSGKLDYKIKSIFDFINFEKIEDNMIIQKNGKYLMVIECQGINYDLMSEMERTSVEQGFLQFLNTLREEIQIYIQTRTVNLENSISSYKEKFENIKNKYLKLEEKYRNMKKTKKYPDNEMQKAYIELIKQKNKYEYTKDIIADIERKSLNSSVLHKRYYIIIPYYKAEIETGNYSKDEIQNMIFSELYTKARTIIRTLSRCEINANILDSEELIDLLYVAYNRDESDIFNAKKMLKVGFEDIYSTAPNVIDKKMQVLDRQIEEEGMKIANEAVKEAISDKEMLLRIREENKQELIYDFADTLIEENKSYIGDDVSADAKAKVKKQRKERKKGGKQDVKEKKAE